MQFARSSRRRRFGLELRFADVFGVESADRDRDRDRDSLSQVLRRTEQQQEPAEEEQEGHVLFGTLQGSVVGLRYYTGVVNKGEMVSLVREPQNPYDRNAVMVTNVYGNQVGHIRRQLAAPMAHIMDNNLAKVEGVVPYRTNNQFTMPVHLSFWGKEEKRMEVVNELSNHGFKLAPGSKGLSASGQGPSRAGTTLERFWTVPRKTTAVALTPEQLKNVFDKLFDDLMEDKTREMEAAEAVGTPLLPHQKQALAWMASRENSNDLPPFWEQQNNLYLNVLTNFAVKERPDKVQGGILADDMGLGKTLTTIALILTNFHNGKPLPLQKCAASPKSAVRVPKMVKGRNSSLESERSRSHFAEETPKVSASSSHPKRGSEASDVIVISDSDDAGEGVAPKKRAKRKESKGETSTSSTKGSVILSEDSDFAAALGEFLQGPSSQKKKAHKKRGDDTQGKTGKSVGARATLIVCPLSVLSNWLDQFEQHVSADVKMNVHVYYGTERIRDPKFLAKQDVVLTTYNILSTDYTDKRSSPLQAVSWLRVVLDEGHIVRNPAALQSKAVLALTAERRWVLSGTPVQNSLKDLWMLISFLKLKPFDIREWWNRVIQRPVMLGDHSGLQNLQALVKGITLRRTKNSRVGGRLLVELPQKKVFVEHVTLTEDERRRYERVRKDSRAIIKRYFREGTVLTNYADVLAILVRLRQFCCHPQLLEGAATPAGPTEKASTPDELRQYLVKKISLVLSSGSDEECAVCLDSLRQPVITYCAHVYCKPCICEVIRSEKENAKCPLCRMQLNIKELVEYPGEQENLDAAQDKDECLSSSKVDALMVHLFQLRSQDPKIKSLVVSQFTSFLSLLEVPLRQHGFDFTRLDGSMNQKSRVKAIQAFQDTAQGSPTIMLLSLKAGGVGLNLTAASRVFLMDPAWNPAAEDQCFDRCHRLGQKVDVVIIKFIVKDSVEENMVEIQQKKQKLVEKAFGMKNAEERKQSRIEDIRALMEL
ncbi:helicase-like transcription factor isoform X2 [Scleropages formosus]|uniref:helicase-like transcription factor isoform X2 n=1 Tax=Scleropages formosus TaxID=113540 RepID=UPI0010FAA15F|nr:helicase-like transcription factor isoform X2 [Scleropages formosus]